MDGMTVAGLLARCADWLLEVKADGDRLDIRQVVPCDPPPADLLEAMRERKAEVLAWLQWEDHATALWRAVFGRLCDRADLPADPQYQVLERVAEAAHRRHDRAALVDALLDLENHAKRTRVQP
ncbi:MAG: hypothetical protein GX537_10305 [Actinobacteria bacterium]|nr:hypothetical protein [Actinomycetota bacterium]